MADLWTRFTGVISPATQMESRGAAVSPGRALRQWDEERGSDAPDDVISDDAFDIPAKNASIQRLRRWRVCKSESLFVHVFFCVCVCVCVSCRDDMIVCFF